LLLWRLTPFLAPAHLQPCLVADADIRLPLFNFFQRFSMYRVLPRELIGWRRKVKERGWEACSWSDRNYLLSNECELEIWKRVLSCFSHITLHIWWTLLAHKILSISQGTLCFCSWLLLFLELFSACMVQFPFQKSDCHIFWNVLRVIGAL
jgi:hypothetical protein